MAIYYGKSADGSDAKEFEGFYLSSCGEYWSNEPFTPKSERQLKRVFWRSRLNNMLKSK